jgi:hypothetical protein
MPATGDATKVRTRAAIMLSRDASRALPRLRRLAAQWAISRFTRRQKGEMQP